MNKLKWIDRTIRTYLGLKPSLVGVKIRKKGISEKESNLKPKDLTAFCNMVRLSSLKGEIFLYDEYDELCSIAKVVMGFRDSENMKVDAAISPAETSSVLISPLDKIREQPDIILAVLNPKQTMELALILSKRMGTPITSSFRGEASCAEFAAKPYIEKRLNASLLCHGARTLYSDFQDNELVCGAPSEVFIELAEAIENAMKRGEALCGCSTSNIPITIIKEFEKANLSKGTDYFFGKFDGYNIRVYLNKDLQGLIRLITIHLPLKTSKEEDARILSKKLGETLQKPYQVKARGYWLDVTLTGSAEELGIDLREGNSLQVAILNFLSKITQHLKKVGV